MLRRVAWIAGCDRQRKSEGGLERERERGGDGFKGGAFNGGESTRGVSAENLKEEREDAREGEEVNVGYFGI